jgi:mono/diheme cytochrome c family protein
MAFPPFLRGDQRRNVLSLLLAALTLVPGRALGAAEAVGDESYFDDHVLPILRESCFGCHGAEARLRGNLRLTSRAGVLAGGDLGPAVDLEDPDASLLLEAVNYEGLEMPPSGQLPPAQIAVLRRWIEIGLPWSKDREDFGTALETDAESGAGPPQIDAEARRFWSFQPPRRPAVPETGGHPWVKTAIDAFVLARLKSAGLTPAPAADRAALIRRASYDLVGLPPSPAAVAAFQADTSPHAFAKVVDRLLASPHYGERWGRRWLDLVRYAESNSYERDAPKPFVWRFRDYVIRSLNEDKPYDQFVREQLAGDELPQPTAESIIATGYYRLGRWQDEPVDPEQELYEDLDDIVTTTGQVFLGLTVNCARCHDHKLDPFPQRDYYRFLAFFHGITRYGERSAESVARASLRDVATDAEKVRQSEAVQRHRRQLAEVQRELRRIEDQVRPDFEDVEREEFQFEQHKIPLVKKRVPRILSQESFAEYVALKERERRLQQYRLPALRQALCVTEIGPQPRETFVLIRGNAHARGERVEPGFPQVLSPPAPEIEPPGADSQSCGRRLALARWITSPDNPLTARVIANRIWQYHFGRGIVRTANDFGYQGSPPTHPELLDWLAAELVAGGWKWKRMHRLIMLSSAYQMSSRAQPPALAQDPQNDLFWRMDMRRLEAEEIRDSILAVTGTLNDSLFGPSMYPEIPAAILATQSRPGADWQDSPASQRARRSIYIHTKRSLITPLIASFDGADPDATCPVRFVTTQPTQALGLLNSDFLQQQARVFARDLRRQAGAKPRDQVQLALTRVTQRQPATAEVDRGCQLIRSFQRDHRLSAQRALDLFCLMALNLNEFIYLD